MRKTSYFLSQSDTRSKPAENRVCDFSRAFHQMWGFTVNSDWSVSVWVRCDWPDEICIHRDFGFTTNRFSNNSRILPTIWLNPTSFNQSASVVFIFSQSGAKPKPIVIWVTSLFPRLPAGHVLFWLAYCIIFSWTGLLCYQISPFKIYETMRSLQNHNNLMMHH